MTERDKAVAVPCPTCDGTGWTIAYGRGSRLIVVRCRSCGGTGSRVDPLPAPAVCCARNVAP